MKSILTTTLLLSGILAQDPGVPAPNPSISYWQLPPLEGVADHQSRQLPSEADVVIVGSGMSGTSVVWHLLKGTNYTRTIKIAMIEARQACSGATGRNGGHIRPSSYAEYAGAKEGVSQAEAAKITRLRSAHVEALISAANSLPEDGRQAAEARVVDSIDAFFDDAQWRTAVEQLEILKKEIPDIGKEWSAFEKDEARRISLLPEAVGILTGTPKMAGAIWPYRFITHALKSLLATYPGFSLDTNTTALNVFSISDPSTPFNFEVSTTRGSIRTKHVVYATNAWTPHLVPGLQGVIQGVQLHMSAQLGGSGLPKAGSWPSYTNNGSLPGGRAWSLYQNGLDYVVQMPRNGEYMFGGDIVRPDGNALEERFPTDAGPPNHISASYLNGALSNYFGYDNWGSERTDFPEASDTRVWHGRTKRVWVGIEGGSSDSRPFVGRLPQAATARPVKNAAAGGEWVSAAFDGEGMCFAWLCGRALSQMMTGGSDAGNSTANAPEWFPQSFLVTEERLAKRNVTRRQARRWMYPRMANVWNWN